MADTSFEYFPCLIKCIPKLYDIQYWAIMPLPYQCSHVLQITSAHHKFGLYICKITCMFIASKVPHIYPEHHVIRLAKLAIHRVSPSSDIWKTDSLLSICFVSKDGYMTAKPAKLATAKRIHTVPQTSYEGVSWHKPKLTGQRWLPLHFLIFQ